MLLEVMVSRSLEYNFVSLLGGQYNGMSYERIRCLSIHEGMDNRTNGGQGRDYPGKKKTVAGRGGNEGMNSLQHVRSLSMFQLHGNKLLDQLGNFTLLRVLDLEGCMGIEKKHVRYACQLHLLKFLSFKGTSILEVPPQINNLEHLQTLDLRDSERLLNKLPATMMELWRNLSACIPTTIGAYL
jgi:disease resistance protein RPM1